MGNIGNWITLSKDTSINYMSLKKLSSPYWKSNMGWSNAFCGVILKGEGRVIFNFEKLFRVTYI